MGQAYSRLKRVLSQKKMSVPELQRRIRQRGLNINLKSLYRLSDEQQPLERLDMRVAGAICEVCDVSLSDLIVFETHSPTLYTLPEARQKRLDELMPRHNGGELTEAELEELRGLVHEAEEITLRNARLLQQQRQRIEASGETLATA
jgi:DNA-binding Xre family transcriptional regulator